MKETTTTPIVCTTMDDINAVCEKLTEACRTRNVTLNVYRELEYFGSVAPLPLKRRDLEIRQKTDAGGGLSVYTRETIPGHNIATFYPVHALGRDEHIKINDTERGDEIFVERIARYALTNSRYITVAPDDEGKDEPTRGVLVIGNPNNRRDSLFFGHLIGDAGGNVFEDTPFEKIKDWTTFRNKVAAYYITASKRRNCFFVLNKRHTLTCIETTRDIEAGEELLVMRGAEYWFRRTYDKKDEHNLCHYLFELLRHDSEFSTWINTLMQH